MQRKDFIKTAIMGAAGMTTLSAFNKLTEGLDRREGLMPVLFIGHGSPMNGIEDNQFSRRWKKWRKKSPYLQLYW